MLLLLSELRSYTSLREFLSVNDDAQEYYKMKHPDYSPDIEGQDDPTEVEGFCSDTDSIAEYYRQLDEGVYNVFYDEGADLIVVQQLIGISSRKFPTQ